MANGHARAALLELLDRRVFDPILSASPSDYSSESDRDRLDAAQERARRDKERYHKGCAKADDVRARFLDDTRITSVAPYLGGELAQLNLPALPELTDEFMALCEHLGVGKRAA